MTEQEMRHLDVAIAKLSEEELRVCLTEMIECAYADSAERGSAAMAIAVVWGLV